MQVGPQFVGVEPGSRTRAKPLDWLLRAVLLIAWCATSGATAQALKPRVPPGADPGGVAVAFIGPGIDYTWPEIARRLARDGEGEIIGWDFLDGDRRPFERCERSAAGDAATCATGLAWQILQDANRARLIAVRASGERPQTLVQAFGLIALSPAQIVLLAPSSPGQPQPIDARFLREAGQRFPAMLIVTGAAPASEPGQTMLLPSNVLTVAADSRAWSGPAADVAVATADPVTASDGIAAARVVALSARLLAAEPGLDGAGLRRRVLALSRPPAATGQAGPRHGVIERPEQHRPGSQFPAR